MIFISVIINCYTANTFVLTCVDLEVHPEVAGVAESLTAVFTLVRFHSNVSHEVHVELCGCDKGPGAHAALELLLPYVTLTLRSGCNRLRAPVSVTSTVSVFTVCLSCSVGGVAGPRGRRGAGCPVVELLLLMGMLLMLLLCLLLLLLSVVLLGRAVAVRGLVLVVVAVQMSLQLREGGALFTTLTDVALRYLRNA